MQTAQTSTKQQFTAAGASTTAGKTTPDTVVGGTDGVWMESGWSSPSKMLFSRENNSVEKTHGENLLETAPRGGAVRCTREVQTFRGAGPHFQIFVWRWFYLGEIHCFCRGDVPSDSSFFFNF